MLKVSNKNNSKSTHFFEEGDMVKIKHHDKKKFEFKWRGPYHIVRLGHPGTYWIMSPRGEVMDTPVNQRDLAPWLAVTSDNQGYFYDGTTRDFSGISVREFSDGYYSDSAQNEPSSHVPFTSGSLEGDSVTPQRST